MLKNRSINHAQHDQFLEFYKDFDKEQNKHIKEFEDLKSKSIINDLQVKIKMEG